VADARILAAYQVMAAAKVPITPAKLASRAVTGYLTALALAQDPSPRIIGVQARRGPPLLPVAVAPAVPEPKPTPPETVKKLPDPTPKKRGTANPGFSVEKRPRFSGHPLTPFGHPVANFQERDGGGAQPRAGDLHVFKAHQRNNFLAIDGLAFKQVIEPALNLLKCVFHVGISGRAPFRLAIIGGRSVPQSV
jgi:hypothetical protein